MENRFADEQIIGFLKETEALATIETSACEYRQPRSHSIDMSRVARPQRFPSS